jgi:hypothetical protein
MQLLAHAIAEARRHLAAFDSPSAQARMTPLNKGCQGSFGLLGYDRRLDRLNPLTKKDSTQSGKASHNSRMRFCI